MSYCKGLKSNLEKSLVSVSTYRKKCFIYPLGSKNRITQKNICRYLLFRKLLILLLHVSLYSLLQNLPEVRGNTFWEPEFNNYYSRKLAEKNKKNDTQTNLELKDPYENLRLMYSEEKQTEKKRFKEMKSQWNSMCSLYNVNGEEDQQWLRDQWNKIYMKEIACLHLKEYVSQMRLSKLLKKGCTEREVEQFFSKLQELWNKKRKEKLKEWTIFLSNSETKLKKRLESSVNP